MIDIHSHILPGVDDGAASLEDALELARQSLDSGICRMVATPHYNYGGSASLEEIKNAYLELTDALEYEQLPLHLQLGMEILASEDLPELLKAGKVWTYPRSRYFLVEFLPNRSAAYMDLLLRRCEEAGFMPVVAHPERYEQIREDPRILRDWKNRGYGIQLNRDSLLGRFGSYAACCAQYLLHHRMVNCIASDAHDPYRRNADWEAAFGLFDREFDPAKIEKCLRITPKKILHNADIL
mgnify:CR=1 FL=1